MKGVEMSEISGVFEDDLGRLMCERIVNYSWSKVSRYRDEIESILERGEISSEKERALIFAAANAFMQTITLEEIENERLGLTDTIS